MPTSATAPSPPAGFYFHVQIMDPTGAAPAGDSPLGWCCFQEVLGLGAERESSETASEGGLNAYRHLLPPAVKTENLVLKRGIVPTNHPLVQWCRSTLEGDFSGPIQAKELSLQLLSASSDDGTSTPIRQWSFHQAYPCKWEVAAFRPHKNEVAIERIEFAYSYSRRRV